jgi:hypothetical protein
MAGWLIFCSECGFPALVGNRGQRLALSRRDSFLVWGAAMKKFVAIASSIAVGLIVADGGMADLGKGKSPTGMTVAQWLGKGKAPIGKGKGKAPPPPVVTKG